ncbi:MAG: sortase [Bacillota bacterium]|nr:sortase [Bacillota bacterium]
MEHKKKNRRMRIFILFIIVVCLIPIGQAYYASVRHRAQQNELKELVQQEDNSGLPEETKTQGTEISEKMDEAEPQNGEEPEKHGEAEGLEEPEEPSVLTQYKDLYEKNSDIAGWLSIEGTVIDYPVMQCEDDEYYLHHDFYGNENQYGCLYVRGMADVNTPGTNFIIYGHNMKDGSMFGDLDLYRNKEFYLEHSMISFDTLYEQRSYEIVAVFLSQVYNSDEEVFKYYQFYQADTQEEFDYFYENIKELSLYDTGVTAEFGDTFLTLSTCAYHVEDGRFVVVARKI